MVRTLIVLIVSDTLAECGRSLTCARVATPSRSFALP